MIWEKLAFNLSAGPMCVLTAAPVNATHAEPVLVAASRRVMAGPQALIRAIGRHVSVDVERTVEVNTKLGHRPSILQDLTAGRPMEIDALYSVALEMARMAGVAMPTMELLAALIRVRAREAGLYGRWRCEKHGGTWQRNMIGRATHFDELAAALHKIYRPPRTKGVSPTP